MTGATSTNMTRITKPPPRPSISIWTLDAIERCVLPRDPETAFQLIVRFFERDTELGQDDLEAISKSFRRAARLFRTASTACPPHRV